MNKELFRRGKELDVVSRTVLQLCRNYQDTLSIPEVSLLLVAGGNKFAYEEIERAFKKLVNDGRLPKRYLGSKMN